MRIFMIVVYPQIKECKIAFGSSDFSEDLDGKHCFKNLQKFTF